MSQVAIETERRLDWVDRIRRDLTRQRFYGTLRLVYESGTVVRIVKEESLKPPQETLTIG